MAVLDTTLGGATIAGTLGITGYPVTIAAWVRRDAADSRLKTIAGLGNPDGAENFQRLAVNQNEYAFLRARYNNGSISEFAETSGTLASNTWVPIVGRFQQASRQLFRAALANTNSSTTDIGGWTGAVVNPLNAFGVGRAVSGTDYFLGQMSHIAVWNGLLSDSDVEAFLNGGNPLDIAAASLRAYWAETIENVGGTNYYRDETVNNYDLTLDAGAVVDTTTAAPTVAAPATTETLAVVITGIKEANEADSLVTDVTNAVVRIDGGNDIVDQTISAGQMTVLLDGDPSIASSIGETVTVTWTREVAANDIRYGRATGTVVDLSAP